MPLCHYFNVDHVPCAVCHYQLCSFRCSTTNYIDPTLIHQPTRIYQCSPYHFNHYRYEWCNNAWIILQIPIHIFMIHWSLGHLNKFFPFFSAVLFQCFVQMVNSLFMMIIHSWTLLNWIYPLVSTSIQHVSAICCYCVFVSGFFFIVIIIKEFPI